MIVCRKMKALGEDPCFKKRNAIREIPTISFLKFYPQGFNRLGDIAVAFWQVYCLCVQSLCLCVQTLFVGDMSIVTRTCARHEESREGQRLLAAVSAL